MATATETPKAPRDPEGLIARISRMQDTTGYQDLHWEGSFEDYLRVVKENPKVTRTAFQRIYDMILSHGKSEYVDNKKRLVRYNFFHDETFGGRDAIFGLDVPLMKLVNVFKSAAHGYGTESRVILLHGPVGSVEVDHRPAAEEGPRGILQDPRGRALHLLVDPRQGGREEGGHALPDA